jgi:hypothetical protein
MMSRAFRVGRGSRDSAIPDLIIAGAQKAGTTFLFNYLSQHPSLCPAREKEVRFFSQDVSFDRGSVWYQGFFPAPRSGRLVFEASPDYMFCERAAARIATFNPDVRLVFSLRNPTERAFSAWNMYRAAHARPVLPLFPRHRFDERVCDAVDHLLHCDAYPSFEDAVRLDLENPREEVLEVDFVRVGYYDEHLARFFRFFSRSQVLVITREEMLRERQAVVGKVTDFLGISPLPPVKQQIHRSGIAAYESAIPDDIAALLNEVYRPHNERLYEMIGFDPGWNR